VIASQNTAAVVLTMGLAMAASPFGILAIVVMLGTRRPLVNGWAFAAGWMCSITIVGILAVALENEATSGSGSSGSAAVQIAFGVLLLVGGGVLWLRRHRGASDTEPAWMRRASSVGPFFAFGLGLVLPTWGIIAPAVNAILGSGFSRAEAIGLYAAFVVAASITLLVPLVIYTARRNWARSMMAQWQAWLLANNRAVVAVVLAVLGVMFIGRGIVALP
jgi:hypothetical protein